jgi:hypothetical protein
MLSTTEEQQGRTEVRASILMPSLNHVDFIAAAVHSVMSQDIADLELIVTDGGSTDGTQGVLASLAQSNPGRLRWCSGPDGGPAAAINQAARMARGAVLGWLNSDDLYTPGAIARALAHFQQQPEHRMVYGQGEHIDLFGVPLGPYPTRGSETPLEAFAEGCFICQPTVFIRRDTWLALGGLDESLRASFDFELWLRLFKTYPQGIGFIDALQARSRLHSGGITLRMREQVAVEGLTVLRRHLGYAPVEWLLTHVTELCEQHPFATAHPDLQAQLLGLQQRAAHLLDAPSMWALNERLATDRAVNLATPELFVSVYPDGWAPQQLDVRWRQPAEPARRLRLQCSNASPTGDDLDLEIQPADGAPWRLSVPANGSFTLDLDLNDQRPDARVLFRIRCLNPFVPAELDSESEDRRALAFMVDACSSIR